MDINKLYAVHLFEYATNSFTMVGLFRDENTAIMFKNDKNDELKKKDRDGASLPIELKKKNEELLPTGRYVVRPIYTDF